MEAFLIYTVKAGVILIIGYIVYKLLLANENQPGLNRLILILILFASFLCPLFDVRILSPEINNVIVANLKSIMTVEAPADNGGATGHVIDYVSIIFWIYTIGASVTFISFAVACGRLAFILKSAEIRPIGKYRLAVLEQEGYAPFSWLRYIVMTKDDVETCGDVIITHETAHLRALHWIDSFIAQFACIVFWYNPASWLIRNELRNVHEYQADRKVLESGTDARYYQMLLVKKAVGRKMPSLANSLNHSKLKKRITMMCNSKTGKARRLRALAMLPALGLAIAVINPQGVKASSIPDFYAETGTVPSDATNREVSENNVAAQAEKASANETPAKFPGGESRLVSFLIDNVNYPSEAMENGTQGVVIVQFSVSEDGAVGDISVTQSVSKELDAAVVAAVGKMPKWKPATVDGKAVRSTMSLPFTFKTYVK